VKLRTWGYFYREAGRGIRHTGWMSVASVLTVAVALFVLGFFGVLSLNLEHAASTLSNQVELEAFFSPHERRSQEMAFLAQVRRWPGVRRVVYFSKAEALNQLKSEFPHDRDLWALIQQGNPLLDGFQLYTDKPAQIPQVAHRLNGNPAIHQVVYQALVVARLTTVTLILKDAGYVVEGLLALATLFIIANTIRLGVFARRREIAVMKLVGATDWFIRWPFLLEGVYLGLLGALLASGGVILGYRWVAFQAAKSLAFFPLASVAVVERTTALTTGLGGVAMGLLGSFWALRRFLRV
jgi:cell division transport system permease protein